MKVLTFDFEWFSSEVHRERETKTVSNLSAFPELSNSFIIDNYPTIFPTAGTQGTQGTSILPGG